MSDFAVTFFEDADPALVNEIQARLAKLKPGCTQCGRNLNKTELSTRRCANREECVVRQAWNGNFPGVTEYRARKKYLASRATAKPEGLPVLPPACLRCGKKLSARELAAGRECSGRAACTKRMILSFRAPNFMAERYAEAWAREQKTADEIEEEIAA